MRESAEHRLSFGMPRKMNVSRYSKTAPGDEAGAHNSVRRAVRFDIGDEIRAKRDGGLGEMRRLQRQQTEKLRRSWRKFPNPDLFGGVKFIVKSWLDPRYPGRKTR